MHILFYGRNNIEFEILIILENIVISIIITIRTVLDSVDNDYSQYLDFD